MRRHAKAATAGSLRQINGVDCPTHRRFSAIAVLVGFALIASVFAVSPASASSVTQRPFLFGFDGSDTTHGAFDNAGSIAIDNSSGAVYVSESCCQQASLDKFHQDGSAWAFSATGKSSISERLGGGSFGGTRVAVDNSSGPSQGRILLSGNPYVEALDPSGSFLWSLNPHEGPLTVTPLDVAVDALSHPWIAASKGADYGLREYATTGSPPAEITLLPASESTKVDFDSAGNMYVIEHGELEKWVGGSYASTIDPTATDVYVDQSSPGGHIFTVYSANEQQEVAVDATAGQFRLSFEGDQTTDLSVGASREEVRQALEALPSVGAGNVEVFLQSANHYSVVFQKALADTDLEQLGCEDGTTPLSGGSGCSVTTKKNGAAGDFQEYATDGTLLGTFGLGFIDAGASIAYNPSLDRVYVLEGESNPSVAVFGAPQSGTAPDVSIEAPTSIGVSSAHFSGKVNPQGTSSEWRFEWRKVDQPWANAESSPPQSLPADSSEHNVEYTTNALRGDTTYQVRLVAVNIANQLAGISAAESFETEEAAEPPAVTIDPPSAIAANSAKITGTVNPKGDTADWRVQLSTDPSCSGGFVDQPLQTLTPSSTSPVGVEFELTGLLPSFEYCTRIVATNSAGSTTSEGKGFNTLDVAPTQVFTAYAAPRAETTARVNGFLNPEGSEVTYRFEYSQDGTSWTALPDRTVKGGIRHQVIVGEEVSELQPSTAYRYRFTVENGAGTVEGEEKIFHTRSSTEMQLPDRGIELVSKPEKGNQNLALQRPLGDPPMVSEDGEAVLWNVFAGAPGGNSGTYVNFLAKRTASGWVNRAVIPPAAQQVGEGGYTYRLNQATSDFSRFVFRAELSGGLNSEEPTTFVRIDDEQHQEVLHTFPDHSHGGDVYETSDMTADGSHVILLNHGDRQLEEISPSFELISVMPDGTPSECGVYGFVGTTGGSGTQWTAGYHLMDVTDASRVYFQSIPNGSPCHSATSEFGGIFFRNRVTEQTTEVDPGTENGGPALIRATPDGRSLYFLTETSHAPDDENSAPDIYRWDSESGDYTCLTCVVANAGLEATSTGYAPVRIPDDFSRIYFTSRARLTPGYGVAGAVNLYELKDGEIRFIGTTDSGEVLRHATLTRSGNVMVFTSQESNGEFTADQLADECLSGQDGQLHVKCEQFYRYEASTGSLECLSCFPGGVTHVSAISPGIEDDYAMSADGSTVAFVSPERLLPQDVNGTYDVYEWHNGALQLISDGETIYPSEGLTTSPKVYGMDASGQNIFFSLVDPDLTGYEQDGLSNLYDARAGGGFPRPQPAVHCVEEACQGPAEAAPSVGAGASAVFHGQGNLRSQAKKKTKKTRCARRRGRAKRHCLRKLKRHGREAAKRNAGGAK